MAEPTERSGQVPTPPAGAGDGERLRQALKLEVLGRLAGGVAHDFNNVLTVILGNSELLLAGLPPGHPLRDFAEEIHKAAGHGAALTNQLLTFSRNQLLKPVVLDLNAVVARMEPMLRRLIGQQVQLAVVLAPAAGRVKADPS